MSPEFLSLLDLGLLEAYFNPHNFMQKNCKNINMPMRINFDRISKERKLARRDLSAEERFFSELMD